MLQFPMVARTSVWPWKDNKTLTTGLGDWLLSKSALVPPLSSWVWRLGVYGRMVGGKSATDGGVAFGFGIGAPQFLSDLPLFLCCC